MDTLYDVCACLNALDSAKATERKKNVSQLQQLLARDSVVAAIDHSSVRGGGQRLTWDAVFKTVNKYIDTEIVALQSAKESQSTTTLNNRDKKKQELSSLFKLVVTTANKGKTKLTFQTLTDRIESILTDTYTLEAFGADYSRVFLKHVLRVRQYWLKISPKKWRELTNRFLKLYDDNLVDRALVAKIVQDLVQGSCLQSQPVPRRLFAFFSKVLDNLSNLRDSWILEKLLISLNTFCKTVAASSRFQLCHFGESHMNGLVSLWNRQTSDKIKEELVDLLHLLVCVHHPRGAADPNSGAYAYNWDLWQRQLSYLHEMIVVDIDKMTDRYKFLSGATVSNPAYISLAADIFKQMPAGKIVPQELNLISSQLSQSGSYGDSSGPAKRQRLSPENKSLLEIVVERSNTAQAVPWLQVLCQLLEKYPESFGKFGISTSFQAMVILLAECKRGPLFQLLFETLSALVQAAQRFEGIRDEISDHVMPLWSHCVSTIHSRQAEVEGYQEQGFMAMAGLVSSGLVSPSQEIWNLFLPSFSQPSPAADSLLRALITSQGLPENYVPSIIGLPQGRNVRQSSVGFSLRQSLISWLLPAAEVEGGTHFKVSMSPLRLADALYAITLKDPSLIQQTLTSSNLLSRSIQSDSYETVYLKSTFDYQLNQCPQRARGIAATCSQQQPPGHDSPCVSVLVECVMRHVLALLGSLEQRSLEFLAWFSCVLIGLAHHLWEESAVIARLHQSLRAVLAKMSELAGPQLQKETPTQVVSALNLLSQALTCSQGANTRMFLVAELVRISLPATFVEALLDYISGQLAKTRESKQEGWTSYESQPSMIDRRIATGSSRHEVDLESEMFDLMGPSHGLKANTTTLEEEFGLSQSLADKEDGATNQDICDFLGQASLSEAEDLCLLAAQVLCQLTAYDQRRTSQSGLSLSGKPEVDTDNITARLLRLLSHEMFEPSHAVHIRMMFTISKNLLENEHELMTQNLKVILSSYKQAAKEHVDDQQVCCRILSHLGYMIPHLVADSAVVTDELRLCRDMFFKFVSDFWRLATESSPSMKLEIAHILLALLKSDPDCSWGHLQVSSTQDEAQFQLVTVAQQFPKLLTDVSATVRSFVAESLKWLFVQQSGTGEETPVDKARQRRAFETVFELCNQLLDIQRGNLSEQRWQDELHNRQATCLQSQLAITVVSPVCEKQCMLGLCQLTAEKNIPLELVKKMLKLVCQKLQYVDTQSYLTTHLPYLIHNWLNPKVVNAALAQFPYQLLAYNDLDHFVRSHLNLVVSELLVTNLTMSDVRSVLDPLNIDVHQALKSALPLILPNVLPAFAAKLFEDSSSGGHASVSAKAFAAASQCFTQVVSELSDKAIRECTKTRLEEVIVAVLNCLSVDKDVLAGMQFSMVYPEPNPPHFSHQRIQMTLNYLAQNFVAAGSVKEASLISVLAKIPGGVYQVLQSLSSLLCREHRAHEQQRHLQMYGLFVSMLLKELGGGLEGGWASIIRDLINRLLAILLERVQTLTSIVIPSYEEEVILTALHILQGICSVSILTCPDEMSNYIHRIVDTAANLASLSDNIGRLARELLTSILSAPVVDIDDWAKVMTNLNPLPDTASLAHLKTQVDRLRADERRPLKLRLENLLAVCCLMSGCPSAGLASQIHLLATYLLYHHSELDNLATDQAGLLLLKKVLTELLRLVESPHPGVASSAAICLGAIGAVDLQTFSLPQLPVESAHSLAMGAYRDQSFEKYCWTFHALDQCLQDSSIEISKTAGDILRKVLPTPTGAHFEKDYCGVLQDRSFLFHYLHPFKMSRNGHTDMPPPVPSGQKDGEKFRAMLETPELWLGNSNKMSVSHEDWIRNLTLTLLETGAVQDEILRTLGPMCKLKSWFCEDSLPFLIHNILEGGNTELRQILSSRISSFFHEHCTRVPAASTTPAVFSVSTSQRSVRTMLRVVQYLRKQKRPQERQEPPLTSWHNNFWLDLDYLQLATAAHFCSAHFSAVLFTEIWWDKCRNGVGQSTRAVTHAGSQHSESSLQSQSDTFSLMSHKGAADQKVQELLLEAYRSIGDPDGIYGCGAGKLADPMVRVQTYLHEQQQDKALTTLDIAACHRNSPVTLLLNAVEACGADYLLQHCLSELTHGRQELTSSSCVQLEELRYQTAWRLAQWDWPLAGRKTSAASFHQSLYTAFVSLKDGHLRMAQLALDTARLDIVKSFDRHAESCGSLYPFLSSLQCLAYFQQVLDMFPKLGSSSAEGLLGLLSDGSTPVKMGSQAVSFDHQKQLLHLMTSMASILTSKGVQQAESLEVKALWNLAVGGRESHHFQLAEKALHSLKTKTRRELISLEHVQLEEAKLFWARCEVDTAKNILHNLIGQLSKEQAQGTSSSSQSLLPEVLCTYGKWLAETRSETPAVIIRDYLEKTVELLSQDWPVSDLTDYTALEGYLTLARFADEQYQQIADHLRSPTFEDKQALQKGLMSELKECHQFKSQSKYLKIMERTVALDQQEMSCMQESHQHFLEQALVNYLQCLRLGDQYNLKVFRVVALWFHNSKTAGVNALIKKHMGAIKTYKFLPLYYQLAARMSSVSRDSSNFQPVLTQLIEQVAVDHPHHALWIILALAHAYKDDEMVARELASKSRRKSVAAQADAVEEEKVQAARTVIAQLKKTSRKMAAIVTNMEKLCEAYIELANWTVPDRTSRSLQPLPKDLTILRLSYDNILLPSVELQVDPSGAYNNIVSPARFSSQFRVAGGINLPKIVTCVGSDGRERTQLVKGQDDLRQDAVMQQVFSLVNQLLIKDAETRKRQLKIQTYKVIPLSQKCGLLQWCEGTQPLAEYLIGQNGAHTRYRPNDWSAKRCRDSLSNSSNRPEQKLKVYQEICENFQPVFRHFFMENFLEPSDWFEKRLAYTRSVATNSIVGYILGLGDRHLMNILIDLKSAEIVHIDLGIAFEQGRILPTPETVPFRLTRDIIDGMGITGVEGVFRRCCEKTMEVMKNNSESLLTIVQVLLYDPLSHWSLTPQQALAIQRKREQGQPDTLDVSVVLSGQVASSGQTVAVPSQPDRGSQQARNGVSKETQNKLAERTLLRLRQKLAGQEDGVALSVAGQVNLLIQQASDPCNLCLLFPGWQPYL